MCSAADDPTQHQTVTPQPPAIHEVSGTPEPDLMSALREALDIIDSINGCHGCLDMSGSEAEWATVDRLRAVAGVAS
jgi:hypothetical protein